MYRYLKQRLYSCDESQWRHNHHLSLPCFRKSQRRNRHHQFLSRKLRQFSSTYPPPLSFTQHLSLSF